MEKEWDEYDEKPKRVCPDCGGSHGMTLAELTELEERTATEKRIMRQMMEPGTGYSLL